MERPSGAAIRDHLIGRKDDFVAFPEKLALAESPSVVPAANTDSAVEQVSKLCRVRALNLMRRSARPELTKLPRDRLTLVESA